MRKLSTPSLCLTLHVCLLSLLLGGGVAHAQIAPVPKEPAASKTFRGQQIVHLQAGVTGGGLEASAYTSADGTGGLQAALNRAKAARGGRVALEAGRYNVTVSAVINSSSITLEGLAANYPTDPDGVAEGLNGTKINVAAGAVGLTLASPAGGSNSGARTGWVTVRQVGFWGHSLTFSSTSDIGLLVSGNIDQCHVEKASFAGLGCAVYLTGISDTGTWDEINADGCGTGIWFSSSQGQFFNKITRCVLSDTLGPAVLLISATATQGNTLEDNTLVRCGGGSNTGGGCAVYWGDLFGEISHNKITNAGTYWPGGNGGAATTQAADGIVLYGCFNNVTSNQINYATGAGVRMIPKPGFQGTVTPVVNSLVGNLLYSDAGGGVIIDSGVGTAGGNLINSNRIINCGTGILLNGGNETVTGNLISSNATCGIHVQGGDGDVIGPNTYAQNGTDVLIDAGVTNLTVYKSPGMTITNNAAAGQVKFVTPS